MFFKKEMMIYFYIRFLNIILWFQIWDIYDLFIMMLIEKYFPIINHVLEFFL